MRQKLNSTSLIVFLGLAALILGRLTENMADPDLWGYLSFGRLFWTQDGFPFHDVFSYTPVQTLWVYHEWLTGVIFYPIYHDLGPAGLQGLKYILGLTTALMIYKTAVIRGASTQASVVILLLISPLFGIAYSPLRAQVFTNLFFVLTIFILATSERDGRQIYLWWLPPVYLLWANLHGGFVAGVGIVVLFALGKSISSKKLSSSWLILIPIILVTLINPYGIKYWSYLISAITMPRPDIDEWHSLFFAIQNGEFSANSIYFVILLLFTCLMLIISKKRHLSDILLILMTSFFAIKHIRHQSMFFIMVGCLMPLYFTGIWDAAVQYRVGTDQARKVFNTCILILFAFLIFFFGYKFISGQPFELTLRSNSREPAVDYNYPVGAVEFIRKQNIRGNILTEFSWGEYIIWTLPECKVAMDGRYETVYTEEATREYFEFIKGGKSWQEYLRKYPHDMILFRHESTVSLLLERQSVWEKAYADRDGVLFIRKK